MTKKIQVWKVNKDGIPPGLKWSTWKGMWVANCPRHGRIAQYWSYGATAGAVQEHLRRKHALPAKVPDPNRCGGVSVNGALPKCCEVHMAPWGHPKGLPIWGK